MSARFHRIARLLWVIVILAPGGAAGAQPDPDSTALDGVRPRLFRVVSSSPGKKGKGDKGGTAYLLKVADEKGSRFAYFATCYHVVHDRDEIDLYPTPKGANVSQPVSAMASFRARRLDENPEHKIRVVRSLDLVILRAPVVGLEPVDPPADAGNRSLPHGYVFGFPSFDSRQPYPMSVRVAEGSREAIYLGFYAPDAGESTPRMEVRFITREITYPGMSGGPVVEHPGGAYAGMLLGRMPEPAAAPVLLSAKQIFKELKDSDWKTFDPNQLRIDPPYKKDDQGKYDFGQYMNAPYLASDLDWSSFEQWNGVLGDDPTSFLRGFQEAAIRLDDMRLVTGNEKPEPAFTFINLNSVPLGQPAALHHVEFRWNGQAWNPGQPAPLVPGENLLIVTKRMDANGVVLNDLFRPNPLEVELQLDGKRAYLVRRSLPSLIRGYTIFVTVHNGSIADVATKEGYAARLAIRLDYLNGLVNRVPFRLPIKGTDPKIGAFYDGEARADGDFFFRLRYVSPQTLDAELISTITVNKLDVRFSGVRVTFPPPHKPSWEYPLTMAGRVQFPAETPDPNRPGDPALFFVSPRAHAARSTASLPLPLFGDNVDVDVGPVVREALVCYVNKELLIPEKAAVPGPDQLNELLAQVGVLSHLDGHTLQPVRAFLKREDGAGPDDLHRIWAVLTFRLICPDGKAAPAHAVQPELIPVANVGKDLGMEFVARDLPVSAGKVYLVRPSKEAKDGNRLGHEVTSRDDGRVIVAEEFRLAVPKDALPPLRRALVLDAKAERLGDAVGGVLRAAFADSPKTVEARLAPNAPLQLLAALPLGKGLLAAKPKVEGQIRLAADVNRAGADTITLRLGDNGYSVAWKEKVALADGISATGLVVRLAKGGLTGRPSAATFSGRFAGEVAADEFVAGAETFENVRIKLVAADVDSARKETDQLRLCLDVTVEKWRSGAKQPVKVDIKGLRLNLGTETTADDAKKKLRKALIDALLFGPEKR